MHYSIVLSNAFYKKDFPENNGGNFQTILNHTLEFKRPTRVALSDVLYTRDTWANVREGHNSIEIEFTNLPIYERDIWTVYAQKRININRGETIYSEPFTIKY